MSKKSKNSLGLLLFSILISLSAGVIGSLGTAESVSTWYVTLNKPYFNPPNWLFGPVWTTLYILMGIALYLVWKQLVKPAGVLGWFRYQLQKTFRKKKRDRIKTAVVFFFIHLVVNALWSIVFFGLKEVGAAFIVIMLLWVMILYLVYEFFRIEKKAGILLLPYLLWVSFASVLNYSIWMLN